MTTFVIVYYAFLIVACCVAAFYKYRTALLLLFALTCFSLITGLLGGPSILVNITIGVALLAAAAGLSYSFRETLIAVLPPGGAKLMRTAPLTAAFGMLVIIAYVIAGVFAPVIAPFGEAEVVGSAFALPDENMILGGDQLGRDLFSRLVYGARNTVGIALITTALAFLVGTIAGLVAAATGGWVDQVLGRIVDTLLAIPQLIFALLLLTIVGTSVVNLTLVIALLYSPLIFRLARAVAGNIVVMDYIEAARLRGESTWYVITREVLPNITAPLAAEFGLRFCFVFLAISALSFLGLGIQPPTADWGSMVRDNATMISFGQVTPLIPAAAIALLTVAVNFVVDWMLYISSGLKE
ncbi:MAG: ABC transporter permease [Pseudomonadota bacterium]